MTSRPFHTLRIQATSADDIPSRFVRAMPPMMGPPARR